MKDAVDLFLEITKWDKNSMVFEGLKLIISPNPEIVLKDFENLIDAIDNKNQIVIRAYGRGRTDGKRKEYERFLKHILNNKSASIALDRTNNASPSKRFNDFSGFKRKDYKNYRLSHVWGGMSKNPYAFSALWNMSLTPYFIDPLTGHETKHEVTQSFSEAFQEHIYNRHKESIQLYNKKMTLLEPKIDEFIADSMSFKGFTIKEKEKIKANFRKIQI
jgi:hypothetical protein